LINARNVKGIGMTKYNKPNWAVAQTWRETGLLEDTCRHGVGHPNLEWIDDKAIGRDWLKIHGCDGCCYMPDGDGKA